MDLKAKEKRSPIKLLSYPRGFPFNWTDERVPSVGQYQSFEPDVELD